jgi:putative spermidine/putrescine transport system permease protein
MDALTRRTRIKLHRRLPGMALWAGNACIGLFLVAPILIVMLSSFNPKQYFAFPPTGFTLRWYAELAANAEIVAAFAFSLKLAILATAASTLFGTGMAVAVHRARSLAAGAVRGAVLAPLVVPGVVLGIALLLYFGQTDAIGPFAVLLGAHVCLTLPFVFRIVTAGIESTDRSIEESAMSLGASRAVAVLTVTLPLIKGSILAAATFAFLTSFDEVVVTLFIAPLDTPTLPVYIFHYIQYNSDTLVAAAATAMVLIGSVAAWLCSRKASLGRLY